jgi:multidrug resistance efflux pump
MTTGSAPTPEPAESTAPAGETSFAERALGGAPNPLERIDHLFHHTSKRIWLGVVGIALLLAAGVLWTAVAKQAITARAPAVIVPPSGLFTAGELETGTVDSVRVRQNAIVRKGEQLALFHPAGADDLVSVRSPVAGRVVAVEVRPGDTSPGGSPMFLIAPLGVRSMAIALFPAAGATQLAVGQPVEVTVNGVSPARYGRAIGRVQEIEPVPVTTQRLKQLTGDASLAALAETVGPMREVRIRLTPADTPSGLAWTRGKGPAGQLPVRIRAVASITVSHRTLIGKAFR